ncbi:hypothetical protein C453_17164 [Haloferax elongans ATCC BAA-1513]|uniref:Uncharacterized protein n=1 Tax=Haloferax elongans ATCC BAA-1513 TaxID=1230453 RepID=M0HDE8_HALEO|nr:hypothetical protein [Haloferax elongans]ELZ81767.1 hypothetical protein C453_17164 [Haloferax elongans ATCC BAA-1513]
MGEDTKRRRIDAKADTIVEKHAQRRGVTKREMLEEMIYTYDERDDELLDETKHQTKMLEELCGEVLAGSEGAAGNTSATSSESAETSDSGEGSGEPDHHPNDLPVNHGVEFDPDAREWSEEVKSRKVPGMAAVRGFLNYKLADVDVIPERLLEESMDGLELHASSRRRYKFEYGSSLDVWYPYPSLDPDFDENAVYERIIEAKEAGKTFNKGKVREEHPSLRSCFPGAEDEEMPFVAKDIFLSDDDKRDEWVAELVDRTTNYINNHRSRKAGVIYLSYLMHYADKKSVKNESWRAMVREEWNDKKYWVEDW